MSQDPTQIDLRTVLDAVNEIGVELRALSVELREFRAEVSERFDDLDERMEVLAGDVVKVRARAKRSTQVGVHKPEKRRA